MHPTGSRGRRWYCRKGAPYALAALVSLFALLAAPLPMSAGTLEQIKGSGKLRLGYRSDARPFSFRDQSGNAAGYSVVLCQRIAEQVKAEVGLPALGVEWVPVTIEGRFQDVQQDRIDLLCGADTETLARRKDVSFSIPIFPGGIGALLRADAPAGLRDALLGRQPSRPLWRGSPAEVLNQRTFSVVKGTTGEKWLAGRIDTFRITATVAPVDSYEAGVQRVLDRSSDVFFGDRAILLDAATRSSSASDLLVLDRYFTYEPVALAVERNNDDLRVVVDRTLSRLFGTNEFRSVYAKWFGQPNEDALTFFRLSALPE